MFKFIVFFLFTGLLVCLFLHPIYAINEDLGRHLALGKIIIQTGHVPMTNIFSYTYPLFPFINTHWLSEVVFFLLFSLTGFSGLLFFTTTLTFVTFSITFWSNARKASFISLGIACLFAIGIIFNRTDIRPELFSFFFLSLFIAILFRNREKITKWIYLLPFITLLWVNMHIYFLIGPVVMVFFLIDKIILDVLDKKTFSQQFKDWCLPFGISFVLVIFATLSNPHGLNGALYPFFVFNNYGYTVVENQSIFFLQSILNIPSIPFFEGNVVLLGLLLLIFWKKSRPIDWMLFLFFAYIGTTALRNAPLFIFATFGIFVRNSDFLGHSLKEIPFVKKYKQKLVALAGLCLVILLLWEAAFFIPVRTIGITLDAKAEGGIAFFQKNHLRGPIFNNFDIGSYLIYRLYPKENVFIDGRPEAYPASFFQNIYIPMQQDPTIFATEDAKFHFQTIFYAHTDATPWGQTFFKQIMKNTEWKLVYLDDAVAIFVRKNTYNNLPMVTQNSFSLENIHTTDPATLTSLAYVFDSLGWQTTELQILQKVLSENETYCPALSQIAQVFTTQQNTDMASIYGSKFNAVCH